MKDKQAAARVGKKGAVGALCRLIQTGHFIKGSLVQLARSCGKSNCRCQRGKKHVSLYLSRTVKGKTTMTYIPKRSEQAIKSGVDTYKQIARHLEVLAGEQLRATLKQRSA